jgi:hypothetical protein
MRHFFNKYNFLNLFIVFFIMLLLFSCTIPGSGSTGSSGSSSGGGGSTSSTRSGGVILPLTVGNTWIHNWTAGGVTDTRSSSVFTTQIIGGQTTYRTGVLTAFNCYLNHSDGLYKYGDNSGVYASPRLYLKYPCAAGDSWSFDGGTFTVLNTSRTVTVPAGTFDCILYYYRKVNTSGSVSVHYEYWCPDIGQVKQDVYLDGSLAVTIELVSY